MGIGPIAIKVYRHLADLRLLRKGLSVFELGSQELYVEDCVKDFDGLFAQLGAQPMPLRKDKTSRDMMLGLGLRYASVDIDGRFGAIVADLNLPHDFGKFDLVTNHGTTEHVFDQAQCFRTVHNACRVGGLMVHCVPMRGYRKHCFYLYQPELFADLANANGYETLGHWVSIDEQSYPATLVPIAHRDRFNWAPAKRGDMLMSIVFRKARDAPFVLPIQPLYAVS